MRGCPPLFPTGSFSLANELTRQWKRYVSPPGLLALIGLGSKRSTNMKPLAMHVSLKLNDTANFATYECCCKVYRQRSIIRCNALGPLGAARCCVCTTCARNRNCVSVKICVSLCARVSVLDCSYIAQERSQGDDDLAHRDQHRNLWRDLLSIIECMFVCFSG